MKMHKVLLITLLLSAISACGGIVVETAAPVNTPTIPEEQVSSEVYSEEELLELRAAAFAWTCAAEAFLLENPDMVKETYDFSECYAGSPLSEEYIDALESLGGEYIVTADKVRCSMESLDYINDKYDSSPTSEQVLMELGLYKNVDPGCDYSER